MQVSAESYRGHVMALYACLQPWCELLQSTRLVLLWLGGIPMISQTTKDLLAVPPRRRKRGKTSPGSVPYGWIRLDKEEGGIA